jgi:hypothetical protein
MKRRVPEGKGGGRPQHTWKNVAAVSVTSVTVMLEERTSIRAWALGRGSSCSTNPMDLSWMYADSAAGNSIPSRPVHSTSRVLLRRAWEERTRTGCFRVGAITQSTVRRGTCTAVRAHQQQQGQGLHERLRAGAHERKDIAEGIAAN